MSIKLTKDMDELLCLLYKDYLNKVKNGSSKSSASYFGNSDEITVNYLPNWHPEDTASICWSLHSAGYVLCSPGDDIANTVSLTTDAIYHMENRFNNNLKEITDFIAKFIP